MCACHCSTATATAGVTVKVEPGPVAALVDEQLSGAEDVGVVDHCRAIDAASRRAWGNNAAC